MIPSNRPSPSRRPSPLVVPLVIALCFLGSIGPGRASQVKIFKVEGRQAMTAGTLDGISVDPLGRLELAESIERLTAVGEPFLFTAVPHPRGWVVGTGNAGKVLLVTREGEVEELFTAPEPEIFALWAEDDGTVYAGTSPRGKVYRIPPGGVEAGDGGEGDAGELVFFDPGEVYIWALARDPEGRLLVATGTQGKLYRVDDDGEGEVLFDSDDTHLRALLARDDGTLLVGTAGEGLILELALDDGGEPRLRTLYDAEKPEVVALVAGPDGTAYAGLLASEASLVDLSAAAGSSGDEGDEDDEDGNGNGEASVTVDAGSVDTGDLGRRKAGSQGGRSEVVAIAPSGRVEKLTELDEETLFALAWARGRLWLGTGLEGKLYSWSEADRELVLEEDVDESQVVALMAADGGREGDLAFATTNAAALYRATGATAREGTYTSAALDAERIARFGRFGWRGETPRGTGLTFSFRSGMSREPDRTWSPWSEPARGEEIALADLPAARYVQWRAHFRADDSRSPVLFGVELSYLQLNQAPEIQALQVLPPGRVLVPANFNPSNQVYEPAHPNRQGIFTTLEVERSSGRLKPLWKKGYRTLRWRVQDPNEDHLRFHLHFRPEGAAEGAPWLPVVEDLEDTHYSFDATVLPDGVYRFRLKATDAADNPGGDHRTVERITEPVTVDHGNPVLAGVRRDGGVLEVRVRDGLSPLREAVVSFDAGEWRPVPTADSLLDGRDEVLQVEVPEPAPRLLLLRLTDAAHNVVTFDLSGELP